MNNKIKSSITRLKESYSNILDTYNQAIINEASQNKYYGYPPSYSSDDNGDVIFEPGKSVDLDTITGLYSKIR